MVIMAIDLTQHHQLPGKRNAIPGVASAKES
jgi:hypothetical protein